MKYLSLIIVLCCFASCQTSTSSNATKASAADEPCSCTGRDLDCPDFSSHSEAQSCYEYCKKQGYGDKHHLDFDRDGDACERLH